jgi:hypothetical protein
MSTLPCACCHEHALPCARCHEHWLPRTASRSFAIASDSAAAFSSAPRSSSSCALKVATGSATPAARGAAEVPSPANRGKVSQRRGLLALQCSRAGRGSLHGRASMMEEPERIRMRQCVELAAQHGPADVRPYQFVSIHQSTCSMPFTGTSSPLPSLLNIFVSLSPLPFHRYLSQQHRTYEASKRIRGNMSQALRSDEDLISRNLTRVGLLHHLTHLPHEARVVPGAAPRPLLSPPAGLDPRRKPSREDV